MIQILHENCESTIMPKLLINPINFVLIIITVARPVKFPYYEKSFRIIHVVIYCELYHLHL